MSRPFRAGPRTFDTFPKDSKCPVCGTNDDGKTVLVPIVGTEDLNIAEALPVHLSCAVMEGWDVDQRIGYRFSNERNP